MQSPPNMPQFGGKVPIIGQQQQQQQQQMQSQVSAAIGQIALGIYSHLATAHVGTLDKHQALDQDKLRRMAKDAQIAAHCYFEAMGVIAKQEDQGGEG